MANKDKKFESVAKVVFSRVLKTGPEGVQYATVARSAGVSRAWLYLYFGSDKDALVAYTARQVGGAFTEVRVASGESPADALRNTVAAGTRRTLAEIVENPGPMLLFFRHRHDEGPVGDEIRALERRYVDQIVDAMPAEVPRPAARRFAAVQMAMRTGLYFRWMDPVFRAENTVDEVVDEVLSVLDGFLSRHGALAAATRDPRPTAE